MAAWSLNLPRGFRFCPTDEEIIDYYLRSKITGNDKKLHFIPELHFFKREPWDLPDFSGIETKDLEWFFFSPQDLKHPNGNRLNRATNAGYWKVTGKDRAIKSGASLIGKKKVLVFYKGRVPMGEKTDWVMHEYHSSLGTYPGQNTFVLCRLFDKHKKRVRGPKFTTSESCPEKTESKLALVSVQAEDYRTTDECFDSAENQVAEVTDTEFDLRLEEEELKMLSVLMKNPLDCNPLTPLTSLPNTPTVSSPNTAKSSLEEAESELALLASVFPALGEEGDNHAAEETAGDQVEVDSNMFSVPPEPLDWSFLSPLHSQMQKVFDPFCMSYSRYLDDELPFQYGTNEPAAFTSELWGHPMPNYPDEFLHNDRSSQKNLAFDRETMENVESVKDNRSRSAPSVTTGPLVISDQTISDDFWVVTDSRR